MILFSAHRSADTMALAMLRAEGFVAIAGIVALDPIAVAALACLLLSRFDVRERAAEPARREEVSTWAARTPTRCCQTAMRLSSSARR